MSARLDEESLPPFVLSNSRVLLLSSLLYLCHLEESPVALRNGVSRVQHGDRDRILDAGKVPGDFSKLPNRFDFVIRKLLPS